MVIWNSNITMRTRKLKHFEETLSPIFIEKLRKGTMKRSQLKSKARLENLKILQGIKSTVILE